MKSTVLKCLQYLSGLRLSCSGTGQGTAQVVTEGGESATAHSSETQGPARKWEAVVSGAVGEDTSAETAAWLRALPGMGKEQPAQTDQSVLMDCFVSEEKINSYIFTAGGNLF